MIPSNIFKFFFDLTKALKFPFGALHLNSYVRVCCKCKTHRVHMVFASLNQFLI
jgi:hypothetical protein